VLLSQQDDLFDPTVPAGLTQIFFCFAAFTIGQGGVSPTTQPAKILAILWIPLAVGSVFQGLTGVARYFYCPTEKSCETTRHQLECTLQELELSSPAGKVMTRAEFLEVALISMNQMDPLLVLELRRQYDKLKSRGGGNQEAFLRLVEMAKRQCVICAKNPQKLLGFGSC
jgi:hypothetical protein